MGWSAAVPRISRLVINTGGSLDGQLKALARAQALLDHELDHPQKGIDPSDLRGRVDARPPSAGIWPA